jgi:hypothetical protein
VPRPVPYLGGQAVRLNQPPHTNKSTLANVVTSMMPTSEILSSGMTTRKLRELVLFLPACKPVLHFYLERSSRVADVAPHILAHGAFDLLGERHEHLPG